MYRATMETIRVLVVDDRPGLTQDLLISLRRRADIQILGPVPDEEAAIEARSVAWPDLVLAQLDRSDDRGIQMVSNLRSAGMRVMAATSRLGTDAVELALAAGACGVLPLDRDAASLVGVFRRATAGELVLPVEDLPLLVDRLRDARSRRQQHVRLATLTQREREVLAAFAEGATTATIALELGISPATVQTHVKNILGKLGVHSKVEALGAAWRGGLAVATRSA
jgi:DNA-binding NarL/FixJ family response regulator